MLERTKSASVSGTPRAPVQRTSDEGWWTRDNALVLVLVALTVLCCVLCYLLARPFLPPLVWALAIAIITHPVYRRLSASIGSPNFAAGLSVVLVAVILIAPVGLLAQQLGKEAARAAEWVQSGEALKNWQQFVGSHPKLAPLLSWANAQFGDSQNQGPLQHGLTAVRSVLTGSVGVVVQLAVMLFFLFFLYRDRREALCAARSLVPLSEHEADQVFGRIADTIHATVYGTLVVAAVQGALGGLMFWWLGLPGALLWGLVMALVCVVPVLGSFVVWVPAAIFLAVSGSWGKALILAAWGTCVIGMIDNVLYPFLVGNRLRLHTAPVFVSIVGGLAIFGASGLIIGPVILSLTVALIDIWRRRTQGGRPAEDAVEAPPTVHIRS